MCSFHTLQTLEQIFKIMLFQTLASVLTLGSTALAAQLTQVSNYGGSARAKPQMYVITSGALIYFRLSKPRLTVPLNFFVGGSMSPTR
jgi:uncharacterized protein YraI